jgi:hypothetical protein
MTFIGLFGLLDFLGHLSVIEPTVVLGWGTKPLASGCPKKREFGKTSSSLTSIQTSPPMPQQPAQERLERPAQVKDERARTPNGAAAAPSAAAAVRYKTQEFWTPKPCASSLK